MSAKSIECNSYWEQVQLRPLQRTYITLLRWEKEGIVGLRVKKPHLNGPLLNKVNESTYLNLILLHF